MAILQITPSSNMQNNSSRLLPFLENVNLVLNLDTSHCSPQFHCWYNDIFETINLNKPKMML
ncbi:hypothetical protein ACHAW6_014233 [Cyclotella cf. meneghiniana]